MVTTTWSGRGAWVLTMSSTVVAIARLRPLSRGGLVDAGTDLDGVELAHLTAGVALDAAGEVDHVRLLALSADHACGALLGAEDAAGAGLGVDVVRDERLALAGRAALLVDVRLVLVAEVADGGEHGVGGGAAQRAQRAVGDVVGKLLEQLDVAPAAVAADDAVQRLEHTLGAEAAGDALTARLLLREVEEEAREVDHAGLVVDHDH